MDLSEDSDLQRAIAASLGEMDATNRPSNMHRGNLERIPELNRETLEKILNESLLPKNQHTSEILPARISSCTGVFIPTESDEMWNAKTVAIVDWGMDSPSHSVTPLNLESYYLDLPEHTICRYIKYIEEDAKMTDLDRLLCLEAFSLIFGADDSGVQLADFKRWLRHPLVFDAKLPWVLIQLTGGPCGMLAPLQGFILRRLLFPSFIQNHQIHSLCVSTSLKLESPVTDFESFEGLSGIYSELEAVNAVDILFSRVNPNIDAIRAAFVEALAFILVQAAEGNQIKVCWVAPWNTKCSDIPLFARLAEQEFLTDAQTSNGNPLKVLLPPLSAKPRLSALFGDIDIRVCGFESIHKLRKFLYRFFPLLFCAPRVPGALNLLLSLIVSRGISRIINRDFDSGHSESCLIGLFGQCTQNLVNLILTGRASANTFDDDKVLGDLNTGITLRGVRQRPLIGYLSDMNALGYCTVGDRLRLPLYPIWVIGVGDHFTVLYSLDSRLAKITWAEYCIQKATAAFDSFDSECTGILMPCDLNSAIAAAGILATPEILAKAAHDLLKPSNGGICIKSDFIQWIERFGRDRNKACKPIPKDEIMRIVDLPHENPKFLFHLDGQLRVREIEGKFNGNGRQLVQNVSVREGPKLSLMEIRERPSGYDDMPSERFTQVLATKWKAPLQIIKFSDDSVMKTFTQFDR